MVRQLLLKIFEFNKRPSHAAFRAYSGATLLGEYLSMAIATIIWLILCFLGNSWYLCGDYSVLARPPPMLSLTPRFGLLLNWKYQWAFVGFVELLLYNIGLKFLDFISWHAVILQLGLEQILHRWLVGLIQALTIALIQILIHLI